MTVADYSRRLLTAWDRVRAVEPGTCRPRYDRAIARHLWTEGTPLATAIAAMRLANSRLQDRPRHLPPLPPPRSLAYILPILDELREADPAYLAYLLGDCPDLSGFE